MIQENDDLVTIEDISMDSTQAPVSRDSYRVPVSDREHFFLDIDGIRYPLMDISTKGVRISVDNRTSIASQGALFSSDLQLGERAFFGLGAKVVHYSLDANGGWVCGIQWLDLDGIVLNDLDEILQALRKELFEDDQA